MKRFFTALLISFTIISIKCAEVEQNQENKEEYKVTVMGKAAKDSCWRTGREYSFNLKPSESVTALFELIAHKFCCKITDLRLCDFDTRCEKCRDEYGIFYPQSDNIKMSQLRYYYILVDGDFVMKDEFLR